MLPIATFIGYAVGYALDKAFHTHWIYIPGLLLGIAAGFVQLVRQLMRDTRDDG
jgi:F0F1-type ATP synthase assembly protein I